MSKGLWDAVKSGAAKVGLVETVDVPDEPVPGAPAPLIARLPSRARPKILSLLPHSADYL